MSSLCVKCHALHERLAQIPDHVFSLLARLSLAAFFIRSGQTKVDGWEITSSTYFLFTEEYKVPLIPSETAAVLATTAEHLFPALLIVGLASRLSALALLGMTATIQIFVYPASWPDHLMWAVLLLFILARGPGPLSLDAVIGKACKRR